MPPEQKIICRAVNPPAECTLRERFTSRMPQVDSALSGHRAQIRFYLDKYMALFKNDVSEMVAASRALAGVLSVKPSADDFDMAATMVGLFDAARGSYHRTIEKTNARTDLCPAELLALASIQNTLNSKLGNVAVSIYFLAGYAKSRKPAPQDKVELLSASVDALKAAISSINATNEFALDPARPDAVLKLQAPDKKV